MESTDPKKARKDGNSDTPAPTDPNQFKVNWDTAKMKTSYANVCNVSSTREEVTLLFGTNQTVQPGQRELSVELSDRIILSPFAAKRLYMVLNNVIEQYEKRFGELPIEEPRR